jgi:hypothetical protein
MGGIHGVGEYTNKEGNPIEQQLSSSTGNYTSIRFLLALCRLVCYEE